MKLKNAAHTTASRGERTRVETTVAIEFAESWKPLLKSNRNAIATIATMYETTDYACFSAMLSSTFATSSHWSSARSSVSYSSFHLITSSGFGLPANSAPTAWW